ncbi:MAG: hypothetical protein AABZ85_05690, partial [Thermodesulfobacteriota bacterium]
MYFAGIIERNRRDVNNNSSVGGNLAERRSRGYVLGDNSFLCSHIPNRGEQMVRYYGHYSNVSRGKRQKESSDDVILCILEPQGDEKIFRRNWARLIQKIYEVDPLVCPKCQGAMRVISSIEDPSVIRAILKHLGIWLVRSRPPPKIHDPPV